MKIKSRIALYSYNNYHCLFSYLFFKIILFVTSLIDQNLLDSYSHELLIVLCICNTNATDFKVRSLNN
jgi:hypothetical protein